MGMVYWIIGGAVGVVIGLLCVIAFGAINIGCMLAEMQLTNTYLHRITKALDEGSSDEKCDVNN